MLFRKMMRDMKLNKTQFISIFIMSFLAVFIFAGINAEWYGLKTVVDEYYRETNMADAWVYGRNYHEEEVDKLTHNTAIKSVQKRLSVNGTASLEGNPVISVHFMEKNDVSKFKLIRGEAFAHEENGVWIDENFAKTHKLNLGEQMIINVHGIKLEKEIKGFIIHPEYIYAPSSSDEIIPNHEKYGFAFMSDQAYPKELGTIFYNQLLVKSDRIYGRELEEILEQALEGNYSVILTRDNHTSYLSFQNEIMQHKAMGSVFPLSFLAIAMLTILTTMTRMVNNQRTQIGTLKALGFQKRKILFHYVSYGFWVSLTGAVAGTVIAPFLLPQLFFQMNKNMYVIPTWKAAISPSILIMSIITIVLCSLSTYLACYGILKDTPAQTLRPKAPHALRKSNLSKTKLWRSLGFNNQWNIRDMVRSKLRTIMAIVGVMGCMMLMICAFGLRDSTKDIVEWQYNELYQFNSKVLLSQDINQKQIDFIKEQYDAQLIMEDAIEIKANGKKESGSLNVIEKGEMIRYQDKERRLLSLPKEGIAISYRMAQLLGVEKGDEVTWHIYGENEWVTSRIEVIYRTPTSQGITMSTETFENLNHTFKPKAALTMQEDITIGSGIEAVYSRKELRSNYEEITKLMNSMIVILILAAVVLGVVVLYNLGILSFTEREREMATLKVIGFKTKKLRNLLLLQNIWLTVIGIFAGIPLGIILINFIKDTLPSNFDMMTVVAPITVLISASGTFLVSIFVCLLFSRQIKTLDMVGSLKGVE